jgi:chromosomal replication initiation ATPase DnaA
LQEYKKLSKLFFQEASLSLTYRHWVTSLQAENTRLKMYLKNQQAAAWLQRRFFSPFAALERLSSNHWKNIGKKQARHQTHRHFSAIQPDKDPPPGNVAASYRKTGAGIIVGCTLGFAFALGLSLASAGLVLGWSMGWIVLAY